VVTLIRVLCNSPGFLLFDVEMVFIFRGRQYLATMNYCRRCRWGWFSLAEMFIFLGILILGLAYVWRKGDLDWIKPKQAYASSSQLQRRFIVTLDMLSVSSYNDARDAGTYR